MTPEEVETTNAGLLQAYSYFKSPEARPLLDDLMRFCCFRKPVETQVEEGMRRVFLRIVNLSRLSDAQLYSLYAGASITQTGDDE